MGVKYDATIVSLCSKLNGRDRVSEMTFNLPDLFSTAKSYDCSMIVHRVSIFNVSCTEYIYISECVVIRRTNNFATPDIGCPMSYR